MPMPAYRKGIIALILANVIWGAAAPVFKFAMQNISPFFLAFVRFYGATIILLLLAYPRLKIMRKDYSKVFWLGFTGVSLNILFFFLSLQYSPSINVPIIASSGPVFIYLFSILILKEKPHPKVFIGMAVSLLGVILIVGQPVIDGSLNGRLFGNLLIILAMLSSVAHTIIAKEIKTDYPATTLTFWMFFIGTFSFLPLVAWEITSGTLNLQLDYRGIIGIIFGIFLSSAAAYTLFEYGVQHIEAQNVGIFTYIDPIVAIAIAIPLLGETLTPLFLSGAFLVFGGIFIAEGRLHYHPLHRLKK